MINSLLGDGTRSWVRIVSGISKYVTEMSEETHIENIEECTSRSQDTNRHQIQRRLLCHFRTINESGLTWNRERSTKNVWKYRN